MDRGDEVWEELGKRVKDQLDPLIVQLRHSGEETRVTKKEKELIREVADELQEVLAALEDSPETGVAVGANGRSNEAGPGGRNKPAPRELEGTLVVKPRGPNTNPDQPQTPPPEDAVGKLARLLERVTGGTGRLPLRIKGWDSNERSAWSKEARELHINKNYPLYKSLAGKKAYLVETALLELYKPQDGERLDATEFIDRVNYAVLKWAQLVNEPNSGD